MAIGIVDYGMANLRSVQKAFEAVGRSADIISTPAEIAAASHLVLPGVGAFKDAVAALIARELAGPIRTHIAKDKPFLGICLGMQMLFDVGHEDGEWAGLGILSGECVRFDVDRTQRLKVPHMGWNSLLPVNASPLCEGLADGANVYFVHGYHVVPTDRSVVATETDYGGRFVSSVRRGNLVATQFHPEKSQQVGLTMLRNFAKM